MWTNQLTFEIFGSPAVDSVNGLIYICNWSLGNTVLYSINATNGAVNWTYDALSGSSSDNSSDSSPAIGPDGTIYFLTYSDRLYAIHPDGSLAWFFPLPVTPPASVNAASPAVDAQGNIVVGSTDGYVYCISPAGGLKWVYNAGSTENFYSSPVIDQSGVIYAASFSGSIFAITNGALAWKFDATNSSGGAAQFIATPAVSSSQVVFDGAHDGSHLFFAAANGSALVTYPTTGAVDSSPVIDPADGGVIFGDMSDYIYKVPGIGHLSMNAPWPMFHGNPLRSGAVPALALSADGPGVFPNNTFLDTSGQFNYSLRGAPNAVWGVFASDDLTNWTKIADVPLDSHGIGSPPSDNVTGVTNRFYQARGPGVCSRIFGFIAPTFAAHSTNLISNPFYQVNGGDTPQNTAIGWSTLMTSVNLNALPDLARLEKWNGTAWGTATYDSGGKSWFPDGDMTLLPGQSFRFINPSNGPVKIFFTGLIAAGAPNNLLTPGTNYVGSFIPKAGGIQSDLGFSPQNSNQVILIRSNVAATYTYSTNTTSWSPSQPILGVGEGVAIVTSQTNNWVEGNPFDCEHFYVISALAHWVDTGLTVGISNVIHFPAAGSWKGGPEGFFGPEGGLPGGNTFVTNVPQFSLIAFVGPNPAWDSLGTNQWFTNNTYFPRVAEGDGGTNGYWYLGTNGTFTSDRAGKLWLGFNDDGVTLEFDDDEGTVFGELTIE